MRGRLPASLPLAGGRDAGRKDRSLLFVSPSRPIRAGKNRAHAQRGVGQADDPNRAQSQRSLILPARRPASCLRSGILGTKLDADFGPPAKPISRGSSPARTGMLSLGTPALAHSTTACVMCASRLVPPKHLIHAHGESSMLQTPAPAPAPQHGPHHPTPYACPRLAVVPERRVSRPAS